MQRRVGPGSCLFAHSNEALATQAAVLCLHQTTPLAKDEPAGTHPDAAWPYAHELALRGFVCIVPDYPSFGEHAYDFRAHPEYASGTMKAIWDNIRAVDLLESLPEVDRDRIAVIGHSLGDTMPYSPPHLSNGFGL